MSRLIVPPGTETPRFAPLEEEIERYDLDDEIRELDDQGLCIVPFSKLQTGADFVERTCKALLDVANKRTGAHFDLTKGRTGWLDAKAEQMGQFIVSHLLYEDEIFEEIFVNPIRKTVMRHLLGDVHRMSTSNAWVKFKTPSTHMGPFTTPLHADTTAPAPWPLKTPHVANMTWLLTDYSKEGGALAYVPGSHKRGTPPDGLEAWGEAIPVEAPAGSLVFFHGATWHGSYRKETEGLRLSIHGFCCRPYYMPLHDYRGRVPQELFDRSRDAEYLRVLVREEEVWLQTSPTP